MHNCENFKGEDIFEFIYLLAKEGEILLLLQLDLQNLKRFLNGFAFNEEENINKINLIISKIPESSLADEVLFSSAVT